LVLFYEVTKFSILNFKVIKRILYNFAFYKLTSHFGYMKKIIQLTTLILFLSSIIGCKEEPSLLRVYVRKSDNNLLDKGLYGKVLISSDASSNPPTSKYSDAKMTNDASFAEFNLDPFFATHRAANGDTVRSGYFKINVKLDDIEGDTTVRVTYKTTSVQTIYLKN